MWEPMKRSEIEQLYGKMDGWRDARVFLLELSVEAFCTGNDDSANLLRDLANGVFQERAFAAEDAWREVEPNAVPRRKDV